MIKKKENEFERAFSISQRAADLGFDFNDYLGPIEKVREELLELIEVIENEPSNHSRRMDEFGDVIFSVINLARKIGVDPEKAIGSTNEKFLRRFSHVENLIKSEGPVDLAQMEMWWVEAKTLESD